MRLSALITASLAVLLSSISETSTASAVLPSTRHHRHASESRPCTDANRTMRKEWSQISPTDRKAYIAGVHCLRDLPSQIPPGLAPGAQHRLDDFIGTHINMSLIVHSDGIFLAWHRYFVFLYNEALKNECGYKGPVPYWNWPLWGKDLHSSPIFDGSETSLSGDGDYVVDAIIPQMGNLTVPRGSGGGCVTNGPFANTTLSYPNSKQNIAFSANGTVPDGLLDYAPHCLRRDLNGYIATQFTNQSTVDYLLHQTSNIAEFQDYFDTGNIGSVGGPHAGGHYTVGPDMFDFFASPSDPTFFLHHGMVDLLWTRWQAQKPEERNFALSGGSTTFNIPPTPDVTVDDKIGFGFLSEEMRLGDLMRVDSGPFCYEYDY